MCTYSACVIRISICFPFSVVIPYLAYMFSVLRKFFIRSPQLSENYYEAENSQSLRSRSFARFERINEIFAPADAQRLVLSF